MVEDNRPRTLQEQIDQNLRRIYEDIAEEPLPDRFFTLISELEALDDTANATVAVLEQRLSGAKRLG